MLYGISGYDIRITLQLPSNQQTNRIDFQIVIRIHMAKEFSFHMLYPCISCGSQAAISRMMNNGYCILPIRVFFGNAADYIYTLIRRTVVHKNVLQVLVSLFKQTPDTAFNSLLDAIHRHNNTNKIHYNSITGKHIIFSTNTCAAPQESPEPNPHITNSFSPDSSCSRICEVIEIGMVQELVLP